MPMKQIIVSILLLVLFISCDGIEEGVVDPNDETFVVEDISAPVELIYSDVDSTLITSISFSSVQSVTKVWFELSSEDGFIETRSGDMITEDDNNLSYYGASSFSIHDPTGMYVIEYYVNTSVQTRKKLASHSFYYDNTRDVQFENLTAPLEFIYSSDNPFLHTAIRLSNTYNLQNVWIKIESSDSPFVIADSVQLLRTSDGSPYYFTTYYDSLTMSPSYPDGNYVIDYFIKTTKNNKQTIATHNFTYVGDGINTPPEISNPLFYYKDEGPILRDTLANNAEFILSIEVADKNGLNDIDSVYTDLFNYQDPNNTIITRIILFDDGNVDHGDDYAGDGIYSRKGYFPIDSEGDRKFNFLAKDRIGAPSNIISHNFVVVK